MDLTTEIKENDLDLLQWVEYYRPTTLKDILLPVDIARFFKKVVKTKNLPHLLLHSRNPGSGKTSLAKLICNEVNYEYRYYNSSLDRNIDILRTDIARFATAKSITGNMKGVILDEFDGVTPQFQLALKADMEKYHKKCRFILITNEYDAVEPKLISRCQEIDMNYNNANQYEEMIGLVAERAMDILKHRKVGYDDEALVELIIKHFPDIRKVINICDEYNNKYGYINKNILNFDTLDDEFFKLLKTGNLTSVRKKLASINYNYLNIFSDLDRILFPTFSDVQLGEAILITHDYMSEMPKSINREITCAAFLQEIISLIKG